MMERSASSVARASARAHRAEKTVTPLAMPVVRLRPPRPLVATPPTPFSGVRRTTRSTPPFSRSYRTPSPRLWPGARRRAMSPPLLAVTLTAPRLWR